MKSDFQLHFYFDPFPFPFIIVYSLGRFLYSFDFCHVVTLHCDSIMIQSTTCSLCQTVDDFCVNCNKRTCNFHSPDAEASQQTSQRHCKPCYDKLAYKK